MTERNVIECQYESLISFIQNLLDQSSEPGCAIGFAELLSSPRCSPALHLLVWHVQAKRRTRRYAQQRQFKQQLELAKLKLQAPKGFTQQPAATQPAPAVDSTAGVG